MVKLISEVDVDEISSTETFIIDTNVLFAIHFELTDWSMDKISAYSSFVLSLMEHGVPICVSTLNLQELYHLVEKVEWRHYLETHDAKISQKKYRNIKSERTRIALNLKRTHMEITRQYSIIPNVIESDMVDSFVNNYESHFYDPIDFITVRYNQGNCVNFITDDSDFKRDSKINVYSYS